MRPTRHINDIKQETEFVQNNLKALNEELGDAKQLDEIDKSNDTIAYTFRSLYEKFLEQGFTEDQAFEMILKILEKGGKS